MGRRSRTKGVATAALRAAARSRRERDEEAHVIAQEVYATCVQARSEAGRAPLWALGPLQYVAQTAALLIVQRGRAREEEYSDVAAYVVSLFADMVLNVVAVFDREHFEAWRAGRVGPPETHRLAGMGEPDGRG